MIHYLNKFFVSILFIVILLTSQAAFSISGLGACITNPCSCGRSDKSYEWKQDGKSILELTNNTYNYPEGFTYDGMTSSNNISIYSKGGIEPNTNCPPYDRYNRRRCLIQYAANNSVFTDNFRDEVARTEYRVYCAEASEGSTFLEPKIKLRMQWCNAFWCQTFSKDLNAKTGQCKTYGTAYGIPTIRFCARIAVPKYSNDETADPSEGTKLKLETDPGYYFHYLDTNGVPRPDPGVATEGYKDGFRVYMPKICLYEDPSMWEALTAWMEPYRNGGFDYLDMDTSNQVWHKGTSGGDGTNVISAFGENSGNLVVEDDYKFNHNDRARGDYYYSALKNLIPEPYVAPAGENPPIDKRYTEAGDYKKWVANFAVNKHHSLGCSYLNIGPYPPPYCPALREIEPSLAITEICPQIVEFESREDPDNIPDTDTDKRIDRYVVNYRKSTSTRPCVIGTSRNNYIHNTFRVGIENIVNLCENPTDNPYTDNCARIKPDINASYIHTHMNDMLPKCTSSDSTTACVETSEIPGCISGYNCEEKFRVVYALKQSKSSSPQRLKGYPSDAKSVCTGTSSDIYPCVMISGIDHGRYNDISINLNTVANSIGFHSQETTDGPEDTDDSYKVTQLPTTLLTSKRGKIYQIKPYITYAGPEEDVDYDSKSLDPNSICVYVQESTFPEYRLGCIARDAEPLFTARPCDSSTPGCSGNSHYEPKAVVNFTYQGTTNKGTSPVPSDSMQGIIAPINVTAGEYYNFMGIALDAYVVDDDYMLPPFTGDRVIATDKNRMGSSTIRGLYYTDDILFKDNGDVNNDSRYKQGVEYINGEYFRGGKKLVIGKRQTKMCHERRQNPQDPSTVIYDNSQCVLTKLNYSDIIDCEDFKNRGNENSCTQITSDSSITCSESGRVTMGEYGDLIYKTCSDGSKCYQAPSNVSKLICKESNSPVDRVLPNIGEDQISLGVSEYYNYEDVDSGYCAMRPEDNGRTPYNPSKCLARPRVVFENGVSADIPEMEKCRSERNGNATWTEAKVGENSTGTCLPNYSLPEGKTSLDPRYCYQKPNKDVRLSENPDSNHCLPATCPAEGPEDPGSGGGSFPSVEFGQLSEGTCPEGQITPLGSFKRRCSLVSDGVYKLDPLPEWSSCHGNDHTYNIGGQIITITASPNALGLKTNLSRKHLIFGIYSNVIEVEYGPSQNWNEFDEGRTLSNLVDFTSPEQFQSGSFNVKVKSHTRTRFYLSDVQYFTKNLNLETFYLSYKRDFGIALATSEEDLRVTAHNYTSGSPFIFDHEGTFYIRSQPSTFFPPFSTLAEQYTEGAVGIRFKIKVIDY